MKQFALLAALTVALTGMANAKEWKRDLMGVRLGSPPEQMFTHLTIEGFHCDNVLGMIGCIDRNASARMDGEYGPNGLHYVSYAGVTDVPDDEFRNNILSTFGLSDPNEYRKELGRTLFYNNSLWYLALADDLWLHYSREGQNYLVAIYDPTLYFRPPAPKPMPQF